MLRDVVELGSHVWSHCWVDAPDEAEAAGRAIILAEEESAGELAGTYVSIGAWADDGFPTLTCGHRVAAALMASDPKLDDGIELPRTLCVHVPDGMLSLNEDPVCACVWAVQRIGHETIVQMTVFGEWRWHKLKAASPEDAFGAHSWVDGLSDEAERVVQLLKRLGGGLLRLLAQEGRTFADSPAAASRPQAAGKRSGPPRHRVALLGRPTSMDLRPWVRDYLLRGSASPLVQSLVRGHFRRQPAGSGSAERRVIWVDPYWRGPEDAPILARAVKVDGPHR